MMTLPSPYIKVKQLAPTRANGPDRGRVRTFFMRTQLAGGT